MIEMQKGELIIRKVWFHLIYFIWLPIGIFIEYFKIWKKDYEDYMEELENKKSEQFGGKHE